MKAIVYTGYGSPEVLQLKDVEKPIPKYNEILIKVRATAVNSGDVRLRKADPFMVRLVFGLFKPKIKILGVVFLGEIESIGSGVQRFKVGDEVFGHSDMSFGTYAAYKCVSEDGSLALKPDCISHQEAAVIPFGGTTALHFLKKTAIQKGHKVLIFGASGAVGTAAVQLAKHFGATVTAVCSKENINLVQSLGADKVIDYTLEDFTKEGETYDVIYDTVNKMSISKGVKCLHKKGVLILGASLLKETLHGVWISLTSKRKVLSGMISHKAEDIIFLKQLIEEGQLKPVIDKIYTLEQMAEAHTYVEKGHKKGNVAIEMN
ncbi:MAG TPA: NAD(P)-dependent alcohol dehydrogenase [Flavobacterium sp.]|nr:NAD(P)-dependent alcohol dehydrogenase [Flavobacterium sp.]